MMLSFSLHYHTSHVHVYDFSSFATWKCLTNYNVMPNIWHQFGRTGRKKFRCSHNYIATRSRSTFQGKNFSLIVMLKIKGPSEKKKQKVLFANRNCCCCSGSAAIHPSMGKEKYNGKMKSKFHIWEKLVFRISRPKCDYYCVSRGVFFFCLIRRTTSQNIIWKWRNIPSWRGVRERRNSIETLRDVFSLFSLLAYLKTFFRRKKCFHVARDRGRKKGKFRPFDTNYSAEIFLHFSYL